MAGLVRASIDERPPQTNPSLPGLTQQSIPMTLQLAEA
jgi:hypothetical protein